MKDASSALLWLGLALCLLPLAVICAVLMVAIGIANPTAGIIFAVFAFVFVRAIVRATRKEAK